MNNTILDDDCGTNKGIALPIEERDVLDRFLAADHKAGRKVYKAGTLMTPEVRDSLRNNRIKRVVVRSPLRCQHGPGFCKKCFGYTEDGRVPEVGLNVGVMAGQAMGEHSVQISMRQFHTGGTASSGTDVVDQFQRVKDLLRFTKTIPGSATLSTLTGKVTAIKKDPAGGHDVLIGGERHYVPDNRGVPTYGNEKLRVGMSVKKGVPISRGPVNPHEMLPLTGIEPVQGYLAGELHKLYGGGGIRRRNTEVVVKALTNLTKVEDPGDHKEFIRGDFAPTSRIANINRAAPKGVKPIMHNPVLKGVNVMPLDMQEDWMARMNHERISQTVTEAAAKGWTSTLTGKHPIPPVVYGANLGTSELGDY